MMSKIYKGPDNHTSAYMVPRFLGKKNAAATIRAVGAALTGTAHSFSEGELVGIAAYIWYQRSNGRKWRFSPTGNDTMWYENNAYYAATGVFPVCAKAVAGIKPETIQRYTELVQA